MSLKVREKQDDINWSEAKGSESERKKNTAHQSFCLFVILLCWGQAPRAMQIEVWRSIEKGIRLCHTFQSRESLQRHETISESTLITDEAVLVSTFILLPVSRVKIGLFFQNICLMASLVIFKSHLLRDVIYNDNLQWPIVFKIFQDALLLTVGKLL